MRRHIVSLLHPLWPAVVLLAGLIVAMSITSAKALPSTPQGPADAPGGIRGWLYEPNGVTPVDGGWIDIHDAQEQPWMGTASAPDGSFQIANLPPNVYFLRANPPPVPLPGSDFAASLPLEVAVASGQWSTVDLHLSAVRISGRVLDSDSGSSVEGATVVAHDDGWTREQWDVTNANGAFKIGGVEIGVTYTLELHPPEGSAYVPLGMEYTAVPTATGIILEMHIPPTNVVGIVHNPSGDAVPGAGVVVWNDAFWTETAADELGSFVMRGLPLGEFWLQAAPPWGEHGEGLLSSPPFTITISQPDTLRDVGVITLPQALKSVTGQVLNAENGAPVPDLVVVAHRLDEPGFYDRPVEPSGVFTLYLPGGEWHLRVEPLPPPAPPPEWIFPGPPVWVPFVQPPDVPEAIAGVNLEVIPTNAWVEGQVRCPGEPPQSCAGAPFFVAPEAIRVELRNDRIRNEAGVGPDFGFEVPIPDGWYELVVHAEHPLLQGPGAIPVFVGPNQRLTLGEPIVLLSKDARITGKVRSELGGGVAGIPVVGWQPEGFGWGWAETDASGTFTMPVIGGEWLVEPQPGPERSFVFRYPPRLVRVAPGGTLTGVDFELTRAEARIKGASVDADSSERLWGLNGWAHAEREVAADTFEFFSDAPMFDSSFELKAKGGETYVVGVEVPPHAAYVSGGAGPVYVAPLQVLTLTVPLEHKNAAIEGRLVVAGTAPGEPAVGVWAEVFGEDEGGHWVTAGVDPANARYELGVISGTWHLRTWVDPASGYVAPPATTVASVQSGQVLPNLNFEVWPIAATISGRVLKPDGVTPQAGAFVYAEGESPYVGHFETHAEADAMGNFELSVPEGGYVVGAALPGDELALLGWLNPPPIDVPWVAAGSPVSGLKLRFRELDGEIHGTLSFAPGIAVTVTHPAYVWGWTGNGECAETEAFPSGVNTFTYTLRVISGTVWHVGGVYEDWDGGVYYESGEHLVDLTGTDQATQDLVLGGPWALPQPFIVSFDGTQMQTIIMPDGVELRIPPGALVSAGTVTLFIFPTQALQPEPGRELIGAGYEMWAVDQNGQEITQFNKNVIMTFYYPSDATLEAQGISEHLLVPVYYSTLVGRWILADSYIVDTVNNEITLQVDHFTKFGMLATAEAPRTLYLPLITRNTP